MKLTVHIFLLLTLFLAGCENPAANKVRATTSEPATASAIGNPFDLFEMKGTALPVLPGSSKIEFTGSKVTGRHDGGFRSFKGVIDLVSEKAEESRVAVQIDMRSVFTDTDTLTKHLQTGDFFQADQYPTSSFVSNKIVPTGDDENYLVTGDIEMRGVKRSITFPATITIKPDEVAVNSEFAINRKDFGIVYTGKADDLIRDDVVIKLDLHSLRPR
ncbi:MAG TPA: YceI family protein [Pyrinomonadaceae bacterium]|nr:YceI family protein [Pyrinomonadaceae bacterium]